jgi:sulfate adenylyltransferase (ADP) / ATP adenylyltransferase
VLERTESALKTGALQSIPTECTWVEESGIQFMVRVLANLERKDRAQKNRERQNSVPRSQSSSPKSPEFNPFLPYEEALYVADVSPTHGALLNKYNVVDHHLLLITRAFESQDSWLTRADFEALAVGLAAIDGLGFYNGGKVAGASQRHKHLQLIPLPLAPAAFRLPMEPLLAAATVVDGVGRSPQLPFVHAIAPFPHDLFHAPEQAAQIALERYYALVAAIGLDSTAPEARGYNLLATREWMLLVRRSQESFDQIAINALGFAGSFFVRNAAELQRLKHHGPLCVLKQVGVAV